MTERFEASRFAVVLYLDAAQKIVDAFACVDREGHIAAGCRKHVNELLILIVPGEVVRHRGVEAVKIPALAKVMLKVRTDLVASLLAAEVGERCLLSRRIDEAVGLGVCL